MDPFVKLFGSPYRLKLLRLFLFNDDTSHTAKEAAFRARTPLAATRKEMNLLFAIDILKKKGTGRTQSYTANKKFGHYEPLKIFLRTTTDVSDAFMVKMLKKGGALRLVTLSGLFTGAIESQIDLLIVADKMEERPLQSAVHAIEAELGRELRYASFTTEEFRYRLGVYDRLVRDVFDYPHRNVIDKIGM